MIALWIIVALVVLLAIYLVVLYNGLVQKRNRVDNSWAQIDVQLKRRRDLIPNLIETVKGLRGPRARDLRGRHAGARGRRGAQGPAQTAAAEGLLARLCGSSLPLPRRIPT